METIRQRRQNNRDTIKRTIFDDDDYDFTEATIVHYQHSMFDQILLDNTNQGNKDSNSISSIKTN